jgi:hypothetical protein
VNGGYLGQYKENFYNYASKALQRGFARPVYVQMAIESLGSLVWHRFGMALFQAMLKNG